MKKNKTKVLVMTSTFPKYIGDSQPVFVYELCRRLADKFDLDILVPHGPGLKLKEQSFLGTVFRFPYCLPRLELLAYGQGILPTLKAKRWTLMLVPLFLLAELIWCLALVISRRPQVIHAHWIIPQGLIAVLVKKISFANVHIIVTSHGGDLYGLGRGWLARLMTWVLLNADTITVVSKAMKRDCVALGIADEKVFVLPMGVDLQEVFKPNKLIVRGANKTIFVGRLVDKKGILQLIEAVARLRKKQIDLKLAIVGDGPLFEPCAKLIVSHNLSDVVTLLGAKANTELPDLYSSALLCVVPSRVDERGDQEGLGLVTIEALGCGCIVCVSDLDVIGDVVTHEINGLKFPSDDIDAIASSIERILTDADLQRRLSLVGRQSVIDKFDWEVVSAGYAKLISERACLNHSA